MKPTSSRRARRRASDEIGPLGWIFGLLFCLPFAGFGLMALCSAPGQEELGGLIGLGVMGLVFTGVGVGLPIAAWKGQKTQRDALKSWPDQPWMWRDDWRSGRIRGSGKGAMLLAWVLALCLVGVSIPLAWVLPDEISRKGNPAAWLGLMFPVAALFLCGWAIHATLRFRRFGSCELQLSRVPGVIGGELEGLIHVPSGLNPANGYQLRLVCLHRYTTGSGDSRHTQEDVEWEDRQPVKTGLGLGPLGAQIPVCFTIPYSCQPSDPGRSSDRILWRLEASAELAGVDFASQFEVPVFRTHASSPAVQESKPAAPRLVALDGGESGIEGCEVRIRPWGAAGREFWFGAARHPGIAVAVTLMGLLFGGGGAGARYGGAPFLFAAVFGGVGAVVFLAGLSLWLGTTRVRIDPSGVSIARGVLGIGRSRFVAADRVEDIRIKHGMQSGDRVYYDIRVYETRGARKAREHAAGSAVPEKRAAQGIAATMLRALGR